MKNRETKSINITIRIKPSDKEFLEISGITPSKLFDDALKKYKRKINSQKGIKIQDWAGNILFQGDYDDPQVDVVLEANKCHCKTCTDFRNDINGIEDYCKESEYSGYSGDFDISWQNKADRRNVYEYVNY